MHDVREILNRYPLDCQPTHIEPLGFAGGMSGAQFWRLATPRGTLILRRWPTEHPTPERLHFIHAVLAHAGSGNITILPIPINTRDRESFVQHAGHLWELAPGMPGTADYERAPSPEKLRAAMTALAQVHIALINFPIAATQRVAGAPPSISRRLERLNALSNGGHQQLSRAINDDHWPPLAPLARQFVARLPAALPSAIAQLAPLAHVALPLQPCLRDIWHDHVLFTGDAVTGIIDFGAIDIDTPACDMARLLGSLVRDDAVGWKTGLAAYATVRPLSSDEVRTVAALDISGTILAGCNWIRWIYLENRRFENPTQVTDRFRGIVARCAKPQSG